MSSCVRLLAAVVATLVLTAACSATPLPGTSDSSGPGGGHGGSATLSEGTCWTATMLGADPQTVLRFASAYDVPYPVAARALVDRPAFNAPVACDKDHAIEVYKVVRLPNLDGQLTSYATLMHQTTKLYGIVARSVAQACMTKPLADAVAKSGLPSAVMSPMLPEGASLGWAPAPPDRWSAGQRVFACTFAWSSPRPTRYDAVFTRHFPTGDRTCIDSRALVFVDCARRHDRERIAVIDAREAVAAHDFPGRNGIRKGPGGRHLAVSDKAYKRLDAACTAYLRSISTTKKLTGVSNIDVDQWPTPDGAYPIFCEADTRPGRKSLVTEGTVYDRS